MIPAMDISDDGVAKIMAREGVRLLAYRDSVGVWTIGVGHTAAAGPPRPVWGMEISHAQAMTILRRDLAGFVACVNRIILASCSQPEFDAMVSLAFNIGEGAFAGSAVAHLLNAGDVDAAADAFLHWERPPELAGRRQSERLQFLSGGMAPRGPSKPIDPLGVIGSTRWLQASLSAIGTDPRLDVDGVYGEITRAAVRKFQAAHGCAVDGLAGAQTNRAIIDTLAMTSANAPQAAIPNTPALGSSD